MLQPDPSAEVSRGEQDDRPAPTGATDTNPTPNPFGSVARVFIARRDKGYAPAQVAEIIGRVLDRAAAARAPPSLVVMPAGLGRIDPIALRDGYWCDTTRATAHTAIARWCAVCCASLPSDHPPIVLGLDGAAYEDGELLSTQAVQVAVVLVERRLVHVTRKTKARDATEASVLDIPWDEATQRPAADALARQQPVVTLCGVPVLLLVCHDATAFSGRSSAASSPNGCAATLRAQYDALLAAPDAPRVAINLLHQLPRHATKRMVTSPVFQNAHRALHDDHGMQVIAVAGLHPDCSERAFAKLTTHLRCDVDHLDVFVSTS